LQERGIVLLGLDHHGWTDESQQGSAPYDGGTALG
jgi:hypothetical protein